MYQTAYFVHDLFTTFFTHLPTHSLNKFYNIVHNIFAQRVSQYVSHHCSFHFHITFHNMFHIIFHKTVHNTFHDIFYDMLTTPAKEPHQRITSQNHESMNEVRLQTNFCSSHFLYWQNRPVQTTPKAPRCREKRATPNGKRRNDARWGPQRWQLSQENQGSESLWRHICFTLRSWFAGTCLAERRTHRPKRNRN